ncbi:uncharacterized protein N7515_007092 [Penicillium bovifimosum]|uniref:Uncharacterized protein n=1 Tax=Penicillium bovifimosum TaxID=126998 RepID=A0A9W9GW69_9EURO|nr:uncharacterized protein N7515_007092 [Penicillium bovifimosum]KAJ5131053.1 hypothetical protein N7515_007092 [Penicillium bovifimosum]
MDAKDYSPAYEETLPVLTRPSAAAWSADPIHPDPFAAPNPIYVDPGTTAIPNSQSSKPPTPPTPAPHPAPPALASSRHAPARVRKPRKNANHASAGKSTLFWVNSDQQTAAAGTTDETLKRIRSHVMSEHNRKKRMESTEQYNNSKWKQPAYPSPTSVDALVPARSGRLSVSTSASVSGSQYSEEQGTEEVEEMVTSTSVGYPVMPVASYDDSEIRMLACVPSPSIWSYLGQGANDPFETGHTPLTPRMMRHLRVFLHDLTQAAHPLQTRYKPKLQAHWASLIQRDPAILHATICMASSNDAMHAGELPIRDPNQKRSQLVIDTFHHRGETIRLVNEGLSDPVKASSDALIAAVSTLLTIEIASGNPDYLKIHLAGLRQMIALRENFDDVPSDIRFQISWTDIRVACMALARPIFPFIRYTRPVRFSLVAPNDDVALLATRLLPLLKIPGLFSGPMQQIVYDLLELSWYAEWIKGTTGYKEFNEETEDYFNTEVLHVEYQLHSDRYTATGQVKGDDTIEGSTRLALLLFHNSAIWNFYPMVAQLLPKPIQALRIALEATIPTGLFGLCGDLLLWQLFMGAACSLLLPSERAFFISELAKAAQMQGISSWQDMRAVLLGFFYVDRIHLPMLRQVWDECQLQMKVLA